VEIKSAGLYSSFQQDFDSGFEFYKGKILLLQDSISNKGTTRISQVKAILSVGFRQLTIGTIVFIIIQHQNDDQFPDDLFYFIILRFNCPKHVWYAYE
jgi:hypothetical protein